MFKCERKWVDEIIYIYIYIHEWIVELNINGIVMHLRKECKMSTRWFIDNLRFSSIGEIIIPIKNIMVTKIK
jgi:hypothetical protein